MGRASNRKAIAMIHDRGREWIMNLLPRMRRYAHVMARGQTVIADQFVAEAVALSVSSQTSDPDIERIRKRILGYLHKRFLEQTDAEFAAVDPPENPVERALRALPVEQRSILLMVRFEQLNHEQIADITQMSVTHTRSSLSAAREKVFADVIGTLESQTA